MANGGTHIENNGGYPRAEMANGAETRTTPSAASAREFLATLTKDETILDDTEFVEKVSRGLKRSGDESGAAERIRNALSALE